MAPGDHTIKVVVQDIHDRRVDSAILLENGSLKLFPLRQGDYNGDGVVDTADYVIWANNYTAQPSPANFYHGDGNGNGVVDDDEGGYYDLWYANFGLTGNKDFCSDFNRDGAVTTSDLATMSPYFDVLLECASRFEGDANGDGAVNDCDLDIWMAENQSGTPLRPCACDQQLAGGGGQQTLTLTQSELANLKAQFPASPDMDGDGDVDQSDIERLTAAIEGAVLKIVESKQATATSAVVEPTLADPLPALIPSTPDPSVAPAGPAIPAGEESAAPAPAPSSTPPGFPPPRNTPR